MDISKEYQDLFIDLPKQRTFFNHSLKSFSTFRVGGPADLLFLPKNIEEIQEVIEICKTNEIPFQILGKGSNILISDKGIPGATIYLGSYFKALELTKNTIKAKSGASLAALSALAAKNSLTGLEFASGIPGSVGGAVLMNASAYDSEIKNVLVKSSYLTPKGQIKYFGKSDHEFAYRHSIYSDFPAIILEAEFKLDQGNRLAIYEKLQEFQIRRRSSQPIDKHSAGSAFKRPKDNYASKLIMEAGLKGYRKKNAGVSQKHAGFIINYGKATASEINQVFAHVKETVLDKFDIALEPEVRWLGEWREEEIAWKL